MRLLLFSTFHLIVDCSAPLNVIPAWIVQILQTGVALKRIAVYLEEDEVSPQVSSLKRDDDDNENSPQENQYRFSAGGRVSGNEGGLGIVKGTFKWNEVEEKVVEDKKDQSEETGVCHCYCLFFDPGLKRKPNFSRPQEVVLEPFLAKGGRHSLAYIDYFHIPHWLKYDH